MTWTAPFTAVAGTPFTAAQYNTNIRDNLVETEVSRAQTASGYSVTVGPNQIAERVPTSAFVSTVDHTSSAGTYVDLDLTLGPAVSVITGTSALVSIHSNLTNNTSTAAWMAFQITGATEVDAQDAYSVQMTTNGQRRAGATFHVQGLTPGLNIFTAKYRVSTSGTGDFSVRRLAVLPF